MVDTLRRELEMTLEEEKPNSTEDPKERIELPDPTPEMMKSDEFNAIWNLIKTWDIGIPEVDGEGLHTGATGNHVCAIINAINKSRPDTVRAMVKKLMYSDLGGGTRKAIMEKLDEAVSNTIT